MLPPLFDRPPRRLSEMVTFYRRMRLACAYQGVVTTLLVGLSMGLMYVGGRGWLETPWDALILVLLTLHLGKGVQTLGSVTREALRLWAAERQVRAEIAVRGDREIPWHERT